MIITCHNCNRSFQSKASTAKHCLSCRPIVARERARRRYYDVVRPAIPNIIEKEQTKSSLAAAREAGHMHYLSGGPCKYGHKAKRLTSTQQCTECLRIRKKGMRVRPDDYELQSKRNNIRRMIAGNLGKTRFQSELTCANGHKDERLVSNGQCCTCLSLRDTSLKLKHRNSREAIRRTNAKRRSRAGRVKGRDYYRRKLSVCSRHKLTTFMRACIRRSLLYKAGVRSQEQLGYSHHDLKCHIESLFTEGMTWDNYGDWHVDHITPISHYLSIGDTDPRVINRLSNLQPLWSADNLSKGTSLPEVYLPAL